jgi:DnaJ-class molecular chaperone
MTFCPTCEGLGEVWNDKGQMVECEKCKGIGSIKKKRMFPRKDFSDEVIIEEDTD